MSKLSCLMCAEAPTPLDKGEEFKGGFSREGYRSSAKHQRSRIFQAIKDEAPGSAWSYSTGTSASGRVRGASQYTCILLSMCGPKRKGKVRVYVFVRRAQLEDESLCSWGVVLPVVIGSLLLWGLWCLASATKTRPLRRVVANDLHGIHDLLTVGAAGVSLLEEDKHHARKAVHSPPET